MHFGSLKVCDLHSLGCSKNEISRGISLCLITNALSLSMIESSDRDLNIAKNLPG